jgi:hypothetical protein
LWAGFLILLNDFYFLLTVHLGKIFVNNQLDTQLFFMKVYFYSLYVSLVQTCTQNGHYAEGHIPDVILIELIFLMMGTWLPETSRE